MIQNQPKGFKKIAKRHKTTQSFKIGKIWNFLLAFIFQTSSPIAFWAFLAKIYSLYNLNETFHVPYFEGTDFKFEIGFQKFCGEIPKFAHFDPKNINFLILTKFCLNPISNVLISNLTFVFENFGIS